jgi:hypothetical protein
MRTIVIDEYEKIRLEIRDVQNCITEYVKRFFEVGVIVIGAVWYLQRDIPDAAKGSPDAYAYVCLLLSYVVLAFTCILFHKFNTHNRYAGYARAIAREVWPQKPPDGVDQVHLWESVLEPIDLNELTDIIPDNIKLEYGEVMHIQKGLAEATICQHLWRSLCGLWMIIRAPRRRVETKSWTYPFNVAFALFFPSVFLVLVWSEIIVQHLPWSSISSGSGNGGVGSMTYVGLSVSTIAIAYLVWCWLGMGHRMFRLCDAAGDRTVSFYTKYFQIRRRLDLQMHHIEVSYARAPA